jgi:hypothetical protein
VFDEKAGGHLLSARAGLGNVLDQFLESVGVGGMALVHAFEDLIRALKVLVHAFEDLGELSHVFLVVEFETGERLGEMVVREHHLFEECNESGAGFH